MAFTLYQSMGDQFGICTQKNPADRIFLYNLQDLYLQRTIYFA